MQRLVGRSQCRAASRLSSGRHQLVAIEGAPRRRRVVACGSNGQFAGVVVERAELASIGVGGFEVAGHHLVGVESHTRSACFDPAGQPLVQIGAV